MDKGILQRYSTWAKGNLENQIEVSLKALGINGEDDIKKAKKVGDVTTIEGDPTSYPADLYGKRENIIQLIKRNGYRNVIEEFAYTWFNRFVALRFMEVHGFLPHGFRVLSNPAGGIEPEILKNLNHVKYDLKIDINLCSDYKQQGKIEELFRYVLIRQCNSLAEILPMLFSSDMGYLELLLPTNLLKGETVITKLTEIPEEAFLEEVEIIGWMYQFYISSKKDAVNASKKTITKDTLPAVTQLFTPDWIVRYMAQNSLGRLWLESYPNSSLRAEMKYYIEEAKQTEEIQKKIDEIKYKNVNPEDIRIIEPCCGSGHILVYVFDLLLKMYEERGYQKRDIPTLILKNNLTGLDVDKRAAQLASFSLIMKARSVNNRFFSDQYYEMPHVFEIKDSALLKEMGYHNHLSNMNLLTEEELSLIDYLVEIFKNSKTIGSLLKVRSIDVEFLEMTFDKISKNAVSNLFNIDFMNEGMKRLRELMNQARILSSKYDVMITNPPYIGASSMEDHVKEYANIYYPNSKTDMFAMFMDTDFVKCNGYTALINMHSWMFIDTYKEHRKDFLQNKTIISMIHLGPRAFEMISGEIVNTTSFVYINNGLENYAAKYYRLVNYSSDEKEKNFLLRNNEYVFLQNRFEEFPNSRIDYWASERVINAFKQLPISKKVECKSGIAPGDEKYVHLWFEVSTGNLKLDCSNADDMGEYRWFPLNSGGEYRKWYGNYIKIVDLWHGGYNIRTNVKNYRLRDSKYYFKKGITWGRITTTDIAFRDVKAGTLFGDAGPVGFVEELRYYVLAFLNSKIVTSLLAFLNPTTNFQVHDIMELPIIVEDNSRYSIEAMVSDNIGISKKDWDSFEVSWDYEEHPFVRWSRCLSDFTATGATLQQYFGGHPEVESPIELCFALWQGECKERFKQLKANEEELNKIFIEVYGLQDELTPEVKDKDVTVRVADKERDIRSFISYLVGVAMGRYSLDNPGLVYAGGKWDDSKYVSYKPDDDGIIPIYNGIGMEDGLTTVLINLIKQIYGESTYRQNIDFIAEALGKKNSESSEETLNRYLNEGLFKNHLKIYQKRPIYWLFTSGDNSGFKCLVYMHRYNEDTLARINSKYFLPEFTRKKNELEELNGKIAHSEGHDKVKYEKERQNLSAAYQEAIEYGQVLDHMANMYISIDLDDGVKENYAKFQGIEVVTDGGSKVKKDLLAPLK